MFLCYVEFHPFVQVEYYCLSIAILWHVIEGQCLRLDALCKPNLKSSRAPLGAVSCSRMEWPDLDPSLVSSSHLCAQLTCISNRNSPSPAPPGSASCCRTDGRQKTWAHFRSVLLGALDTWGGVSMEQGREREPRQLSFHTHTHTHTHCMFFNQLLSTSLHYTDSSDHLSMLFVSWTNSNAAITHTHTVHTPTAGVPTAYCSSCSSCLPLLLETTPNVSLLDPATHHQCWKVYFWPEGFLKNFWYQESFLGILSHHLQHGPPLWNHVSNWPSTSHPVTHWVEQNPH